jgi:hypothetical protein
MSERNIDARVVAAIRQTLQEIRADIRDLRNDLGGELRGLRSEMDRRFDRLDGRIDRLDGEIWRNFRWLLGVILGSFAGLLAVMAHGFHWL